MILIMSMIMAMMLVSLPIRLKCDHIIPWQHLDWVEMSPQSERVKSTQPHSGVNYHSSGLLVESTDYLCFLWVKGVKSTHGWIITGWFIGEKGCDGSNPSCHWVAQSKVLVKRSTKDFNLEMCIWKNLSKSRVHTGSREPIILGEILPLCKTIEANISDGGAIDRGSRKKVPNIKVSIYFPLWSRCKCLKTIMGNIKRALTITKKDVIKCDEKEKENPSFPDPSFLQHAYLCVLKFFLPNYDYIERVWFK